MTRLPLTGGDDGTWGDILNQFLLVSHNADGTVKDGTIQESQLSSAVQTKLNGGGVSGVSSVNGRGGAVTLSKSDVGLANVDNTSDTDKPVSTATQTALNAKANSSTTVTGTTSLAGGGDLNANRTLSLVNDSATPGNSKYYGTDGTGTKGYFSLPAGGGSVTSVNTRTGAVTLDKTDVGLANVDNTADVNKSVASAAKLTTSRTLSLSGAVTGSASFDGSANATITTSVGSLGQMTLANMAPGGTFEVVYNGTNWTYAGSVISSRPSSRTDLIMQCVNAIDDTIPSFAITGDLLLRVS